MKHLRWAVGRLLRQLGYEIQSVRGQERFERADVVDRVKPYTLTTRDRIRVLCDAVEYLAVNRIGGAFVECGVWKGGSMMAVALTLLDNRVTDRDLWLYDTYDGMVEPTDIDVDSKGVPARERWERSNPRPTGSDWVAVPKQQVVEAMTSTGYPIERMRFVEGRVEDTIPADVPESIALLRIDTDWYESYAHVLGHLAPRLADGGIVIFDDYVEFQGARQAVDDWVKAWPEPLFLARAGASRLAVVRQPTRSSTGL